MKTIKSIIILSILAINMAYAQEYKTGIGIRLGGYTSGINIKGSIGSNNAIEGVVGFGHHSFLLTGLYEHHIPVGGVTGLSIYPGFGAHAGFFGTHGTYLVYKNHGEHYYVYDEGRTVFVPGIDGVLGLEYKFNGAPVTLGFDIHPFADFFDGATLYVDGVINLRYVF